MIKYELIWVEENHNYYDLEPGLLNYGKRCLEVFGIGIEHGVIYSENYVSEFYLRKRDLDKIAVDGYNYYSKKKNFTFLTKMIRSNIEIVEKSIKEISTIDFKKLNNKELWELYGWYGFAGRIFLTYSMTQPHYFPKIENEIIEYLSKKVDNPTEILSDLIAKDFIYHFSKKADFFNKSFGEILSNENAKIDKKLINEKLYIKKKFINKNKKKLLKELKISKEKLNKLNILSDVADLRFEMRFSWMLFYYYLELFIIEISQRFEITKKHLRLYELDEQKNLVLLGKKLSKEEIKVRSQGFLKIMNNGKFKTYKGLDAKKVKDSMIELNKDEILNGMIASKGHVVGKVIKFSYKKPNEHSQKMKNMKLGDIVLTEMTRPNIIMACEKAGAIVTDEGGILCHAAIVSRELKIPCLIGTKSATNNFRDGDYIEVDAYKGIVRKITKNQYLNFKTQKRV